MWSSELEFQTHLVNLLRTSRQEIEEEYKPFDFLKIFIDIKSIHRSAEEWRELKIINYKDGVRSIQNLWKGVGKVHILQQLAKKHLEDKNILNILSLPKDDFKSVSTEIQEEIINLIKLELIDQSNFKFARN